MLVHCSGQNFCHALRERFVEGQNFVVRKKEINQMISAILLACSEYFRDLFKLRIVKDS